MMTGRCDCGALTYQLSQPPLFTHACHCQDCQRSSGSAFGITPIIIAADLKISTGTLHTEQVSERSTAHCCQNCETSIMVTSSAFPATALLAAGTLDRLADLTIDAHIWVKRKLPWLSLPADVPQFPRAYDRDSTWPLASRERLQAAVQAAQAE